jgi:hypothetical protein
MPRAAGTGLGGRRALPPTLHWFVWRDERRDVSRNVVGFPVAAEVSSEADREVRAADVSKRLAHPICLAPREVRRVVRTPDVDHEQVGVLLGIVVFAVAIVAPP